MDLGVVACVSAITLKAVVGLGVTKVESPGLHEGRIKPKIYKQIFSVAAVHGDVESSPRATFAVGAFNDGFELRDMGAGTHAVCLKVVHCVVEEVVETRTQLV